VAATRRTLVKMAKNRPKGGPERQRLSCYKVLAPIIGSCSDRKPLFTLPEIRRTQIPISVNRTDQLTCVFNGMFLTSPSTYFLLGLTAKMAFSNRTILVLIGVSLDCASKAYADRSPESRLFLIIGREFLAGGGLHPIEDFA